MDHTVHPLTDYLARRGEHLYGFAVRIGVQGTSLARAVQGQRGLSLLYALRVEEATGGDVPAACWLRPPPPPKRIRRRGRAA